MPLNEHLRPAAVLLLLLSVLTGLIYPIAVTGAARALFPRQAAGSLMMQDGRAVGSSLIGQPFDDPALFWSRPSAIGTPYDASTSSGSNLGPSHPALAEAVAARVRRLRMLDPGARGLVPVDLVTASASGLDPHISPAAARYQIRRIARLRRLPPGELDELVRRHTEPRTFGFLGEPRVNVGALNHAVLARERPATRGARMVP